MLRYELILKFLRINSEKREKKVNDRLIGIRMRTKTQCLWALERKNENRGRSGISSRRLAFSRSATRRSGASFLLCRRAHRGSVGFDGFPLCRQVSLSIPFIVMASPRSLLSFNPHSCIHHPKNPSLYHKFITPTFFLYDLRKFFYEFFYEFFDEFFREFFYACRYEFFYEFFHEFFGMN